jgi:hypothetical protein
LLAGLDLKKINKWIGDPRRKPCAKSLTSATVLKLNLFTALLPKIHSTCPKTIYKSELSIPIPCWKAGNLRK